jgi:hypothetical protein
MRTLANHLLADEKRIILVVTIVVSTACYAAIRAWKPTALARLVDFVQRRRVWLPLCLAFAAMYFVVQIFSLTYAGYTSGIEPNIASVSFLVLKGAPLYNSIGSAQRYTVFYGPMAYLPYSLALLVLGAKAFSLKIVVVLANVGIVTLLWVCYRKLLDRAGALLAVTAVLAFSLINNNYVLQVRGDILLTFCAALGLFAALNRSAWVSVVLLALSCGIAFDIKFTGPLYILPLFAMTIHRHGWRIAATAAILAAALAAIPFALREVSATCYLEWLRLASRRPMGKDELVRELKLFPLVCTPFLLLMYELKKRRKDFSLGQLQSGPLFVPVLGASLVVVAILALKVGGGIHHFLPFYPVLGFAGASLGREFKSPPLTQPVPLRIGFIPMYWFWVLVALGAHLGTDFFSSTVVTLLTTQATARDISDDLQAIMRNHPGETIEMGYGTWEGYKLTWYRPELVFAGNPLTVDPATLDDMSLAGVDIPGSTLAYLQACKTQIWLIPPDETPFDLTGNGRLFSDSFRRIFLARYQKRGSSKYYEIWKCNPASP